ncbi:MAG: TatD family hydrolase [Epulopiscium sp.]|nr:TatD family hydrolase [Candidatus Epulonipiscium sp.]
MYFESHAHYDDRAFDKDRHELLEKLQESGIDIIINAAADLSSSKEGIKLAKQYDFFYATVGVHPHAVEKLEDDHIHILRKYILEPKVVAIGEIGLDYYYEHSPREVQKKWFEKQITLAKENKLPIIVHSRDAAKDTYDILQQHASTLYGGVIHCYSGSLEMAKEYVDMGFYLGVGGVITFKNAKKLVEVVREIPLTSLLIETDAPYLTPIPHRGKRNDSTMLPYIAQAIADIKQISLEEVVEQTRENGRNLFLPK